jgi:hypothetical protein
LAFWPARPKQRPWLPAAPRRPIPVSRMSGTDGKGGEARRRLERHQIRGVGEVGSSPTRLSATTRVERGRATVRGRSTVVGGQLLSREAVRRSHGAQYGGDEARGGTAWADVAEVLGGGRRSLVGGERWWGRHPGVVVSSLRHGVVVLGGALLRLWLRQSERG